VRKSVGRWERQNCRAGVVGIVWCRWIQEAKYQNRSV